MVVGVCPQDFTTSAFHVYRFGLFRRSVLFHERPSVWGARLLHVRVVINNFLGGVDGYCRTLKTNNSGLDMRPQSSRASWLRVSWFRV